MKALRSNGGAGFSAARRWHAAANAAARQRTTRNFLISRDLQWQDEGQHASTLRAMFISHTAVAFASKRVAPRTSLAWLMTAPILRGLLWPIFLLIGIEHVRIAPGDT